MKSYPFLMKIPLIWALFGAQDHKLVAKPHKSALFAKNRKNSKKCEKVRKSALFPNPKREAFFEKSISRAPDFLWAFGTVFT